MSKNGASILVVDDEREIVRALHRALKAHGYSVHTASSGEEAVEAISALRPDLVLLDLLLPGMSGLEVCRRVRAASNVPIIVLSVKDAERDKVEALDLGADDYVAKPFGIDEVLARVRVALRRAVQPAERCRAALPGRSALGRFRQATGHTRRAGRLPDPHRVRPAQNADHPPGQDSHPADAFERGMGRQGARPHA